MVPKRQDTNTSVASVMNS